KQAIDGKAELCEYEKRWKKEVWSNFQVGLSVQKEWLKFSDEQWDKELSILETLPIQEILGLFRCELATRKLMRLMTNHPQIMKSYSFSIVLRTKMRQAVKVLET
ncbi:MAG: hypothetical protein QW821_01885, partial [Candidatus Bathyarchaeia archaeon]